MNQPNPIIKKIWLSFGILIACYLAAITLNVNQGKKLDHRLLFISESLFQAAQLSRTALSDFQQQTKSYYDAVSFGEANFLAAATDKGVQARTSIEKIKTFKTLDKDILKKASDLSDRLSSYTERADATYRLMILTVHRSGKNPAFNLNTDSERLMDRAEKLSLESGEIMERLKEFSDNLASSLKNELFSIDHFAKKWQHLNMSLFFGVAVFSFLFIAFIVRRHIRRPLEHSFLLESVVRQSFDGIAVADMDGVIEFSNQAWAVMHGYDTNELPGKHLHDFFPNDYGDAGVTSFLSEVHKKGIAATVMDHLKKEGGIFPATMTTHLLKNAENLPINIVSIARDKTEEKKTEINYLIASVASVFFNLSGSEIREGIGKSLTMIHDYFEDNRCAVFLLSRNGKAMNMTHECCLPGITKTRMTAQDIPLEKIPWGLSRPDHHENIVVASIRDLSDDFRTLKRFLEKEGSPTLIIAQLIHNDRMIGILSINSSKHLREWKKPRIELIKTISDILANVCARARTEEELVMYQEKLRKTASELILTEEHERRRIAGELHDRIGYSLAYSRMKIEQIMSYEASGIKGNALEDLYGTIIQTIQDTRTLTFDISPPVLYELGLEAAIDWLCEQTHKQHGVKLRFIDDRNQKIIDNILRVLIFQSIRELVFNIVKHSNAEFAVIRLYKDVDNIRVEIEDNGIGFQIKESEVQEGFGLFSIRERLKQLGGQFQLNSAPGGGTQISLVFPYSV